MAYGSTSSCTPASKGYYVDTTGASSQTQCSAGTYTDAEGKTSCSTIANGCWGGNGATNSCPNDCSDLTAPNVTGGSFSSATPRSANTSCRYVAPSKTDTECTSITANTVSYSGSAWGTGFYTVKANKGAYVSATGNTSAPACTPCSTGYYQPSDDSSATSCTAASAGSYVGTTGASSQTACTTGSYTNTTGQSECSACQDGKTTSGTGKTSCDATCSNSAGVSDWETASWTTANTVSNLCTVAASAGCSANYYKNSNACATCSSGTSGKYTLSAAGTTTVNDCYLNPTAGKYVKAAGAGETACVSPYFCPGSTTTKIYFGGTASSTRPTTGGNSTCPAGYSGSDGTRVANTNCYASCSAKSISNGTTTAVNSKEYYNGSAYPACTYNVNCNATYGAAGNKTTNPTCSPCGTGKYSAGGTATCSMCPENYRSGAAASSQAGCKISCGAGTWVAEEEGVCVNVGAGFYAPGGAVTYGATSTNRDQCDAGLTTIGYGTGANEEDDCGRKLHAGDDVVYLRSAKRGDKALNVKVGDKTFYGALSTSLTGALKVKDGTTTYSVVNDYQ